MKDVKFIYPRAFQVITGGQRYEESLRMALKESGMDVRVFSNSRNQFLSRASKIFSPFISFKHLKNLNKDDIIVFNSTTGIYFILLSLVLKLKNIKTVVIHHHYLYLEFSGLKRKLYHIIENLFLRSCYRIITPSPYIKKLISAETKKEALLLPIPFTDYIYKTKGVQTLKGNLLYIGTIEKRKGLHLLIKSLTLLNNPQKYTLHIVGKTRDVEYKIMLEEMIEENNLNVIFHGCLSDDELNKIKETSDVFVFPSLLEGFGMAINEVKFYGLPVVCFDNSAMPYSTSDGEDGYLVENKNIQKFGNAIETIVDNRDLRSYMSKKALQKASTLYTLDLFKKETRTIFNSL